MPHPADSLGPRPTQLAHQARASSSGSSTQAACLGLYCRLSPNLSRSKNPKPAVAGFSELCSSCSVAQTQHKRRPVSACIVTPITWPQAWHKHWPVWVNKVATSPVQVAAGLGLQSILSQTPPKPAQAAANLRSLCSTYQEAPSLAQVVADLGLHQSASQEDLKPTHMVAGIRSHQSTTQPASPMTHLKKQTRWHQSIVKGTLSLWGQSPHNSLSTAVTNSLHSCST